MKTKQLIISVLITGLMAMGAFAQVETRLQDESDALPQNDRGGIIARVLGLTDVQKKEIQRINQRQRELLRVAQLRLQTVRAAADLAIYDDVLNEEEVASKIQEVSMAQADITKIRMMSEVAVRSVLSPEQLVKFRDLRARFAEQRRNANERRRVDQRRRNQQRRRDAPPKPGPDTPPDQRL